MIVPVFSIGCITGDLVVADYRGTCEFYATEMNVCGLIEEDEVDSLIDRCVSERKTQKKTVGRECSDASQSLDKCIWQLSCPEIESEWKSLCEGELAVEEVECGPNTSSRVELE